MDNFQIDTWVQKDFIACEEQRRISENIAQHVAVRY